MQCFVHGEAMCLGRYQLRLISSICGSYFLFGEVLLTCILDNQRVGNALDPEALSFNRTLVWESVSSIVVDVVLNLTLCLAMCIAYGHRFAEIWVFHFIMAWSNIAHAIS
jgi:hypothetical protein